MRPMRSMVYLLSAAYALASSAYAANFYSGHDLHRFLIGTAEERALASGYVVGVNDAVADSIIDGFRFCVPPKTPRWQLTNTVADFLELRPELRHIEAASLVAQALYGAFPCKERKG
ncbi:MAG TPA: Rap1a/Tai family immunity protein [Rhodocyclaceae bacterium]|nr:Rap1a/Tai family immunity protein [Rhodocyclaceae bacterium]